VKVLFQPEGMEKKQKLSAFPPSAKKTRHEFTEVPSPFSTRTNDGEHTDKYTHMLIVAVLCPNQPQYLLMLSVRLAKY
jgi:hypothetical protein